MVADNASLQDELLHFVSAVLILDHPRLCKPLRTNIMVIKVCEYVCAYMYMCDNVIVYGWVICSYGLYYHKFHCW